MRVLKVGIAIVLLVIAVSCNDEKVLFKKLDSDKSGITFENKLNPTDDFNIIDYIYFYNGGGVAIGDINGDTLPDIFFSGNQVHNRLYLNKGDLRFEDITERAGVAGTSSWKTGSIMGDVNGDGLLDIYVCAVVGLKNLSGHNELFINNGDNTFSEKSAEFGLDFESYSSTAAFLDYDSDGDLDLFLLSHAIHTPESFGHANLRNTRTYESGGRLLRNDGNRFTDVSDTAGIYGGVNGYGLGLAISDFNVDGYPDIYVGNDFHEDDYYYINNRNGTFSEMGRTALTCMSKFSMGNDVADINHDGYPDLISLDMLPEDEAVLKRSVDEENVTILKMRTQQYGYGYQYPRNMLQVNQGDGKFVETALMSNVAATDWSWSALFSDYDQDGNQDLFISNGIPRRPNDLDYIKYVSSEQIKKTIESTKLVDQKALALMPTGKARNVIFKGSGSFGFVDKSDVWLPNEKNCSTASAFADLDNDGDLDLVINNVDEQSEIFINQIDDDANYLKIKLNYRKPNSLGIGTRVYSYHNDVMQVKEMYSARGFQASSEPIIHFGYGNAEYVDSIRVIWPDGASQVLTHVKTNQRINISPTGTKRAPQILPVATRKLFMQMKPSDVGLNFRHKEDNYTDFDRIKLLPYQQSDRGPATAIGDINNDGLTDVYFGGSKFISGQVFLQTEDGFAKSENGALVADSVKEEVDAVIADLSGDGHSDLFVGSGGADFYGHARQLLDTYFIGTDSGFRATEIEGYYENASCVKPFDFDRDGDLDIFVGNESVSNDFGKMPKSYLLLNEDGKLAPVHQEVFEKLGMVTDAVWSDFDEDGKVDLIVVGEWMAPTFLKNNDGKFEAQSPTDEKLNGLWQSALAFDMDSDGDEDYILGNWGLNSKFRATGENPMRMFYNDFDGNGKSETILAIEKKGSYYPLDGFDVIASQIPKLKKKYTSYESFAGKKIHEIFSDSELDESVIYDVHQLASGYLLNDKGKFRFVPLPMECQVAPIMAMVKYDFDGDKKEDVLLAGNYFGVQPFHGRLGSFAGALISNRSAISMGNTIGLDLMNKSVRQLNVIPIKNEPYLLVTMNNDEVQLYKLTHAK